MYYCIARTRTTDSCPWLKPSFCFRYFLHSSSQGGYMIGRCAGGTGHRVVVLRRTADERFYSSIFVQACGTASMIGNQWQNITSLFVCFLEWERCLTRLYLCRGEMKSYKKKTELYLLTYLPLKANLTKEKLRRFMTKDDAN